MPAPVATGNPPTGRTSPFPLEASNAVNAGMNYPQDPALTAGRPRTSQAPTHRKQRGAHLSFLNKSSYTFGTLIIYFFFMAGLLAWVMPIPSAKRPVIIHQFTADRAIAGGGESGTNLCQTATYCFVVYIACPEYVYE